MIDKWSCWADTDAKLTSLHIVQVAGVEMTRADQRSL